MDGSRSLLEIVEHVRTGHPDQALDALQHGAEQLLASGYVEDAQGPVPGNLTDRDLNRYSRAMALHPALVPSYRVLVWSRRAGLVLAVNAAIGWTLILVHELAHLAAARAVGIPARITLSTRLQFLAAQTDVSGVWAASRRDRITVYLAGMDVDVCEAGICLLILALADPHGMVRSLLAVISALGLLRLPLQFMIFMRTDVYFVRQDVIGSANLYADGSTYLRYLSRHVTNRVWRVDGPNTDPSSAHPPARRRAVRVYSVVLLLLAWQAFWASRWWHRHRYQVRSIARQYPRDRKEVTEHGRHLPGT